MLLFFQYPLGTHFEQFWPHLGPPAGAQIGPKSAKSRSWGAFFTASRGYPLIFMLFCYFLSKFQYFLEVICIRMHASFHSFSIALETNLGYDLHRSDPWKSMILLSKINDFAKINIWGICAIVWHLSVICTLSERLLGISFCCFWTTAERLLFSSMFHQLLSILELFFGPER